MANKLEKFNTFSESGTAEATKKLIARATPTAETTAPETTATPKAETAPKPGRGRKAKENSKDYIAMTFRVNKNKLDKLREIGIATGVTMREVLEQAMDFAINAYEKSHGEIIPGTAEKIELFK